MYMHYILHLNKKKPRIMYCETCDIVKLLISVFDQSLPLK